MLVTRAYKTELDPELDLNAKQTTACKRHAGAARYAYNWGLIPLLSRWERAFMLAC